MAKSSKKQTAPIPEEEQSNVVSETQEAIIESQEATPTVQPTIVPKGFVLVEISANGQSAISFKKKSDFAKIVKLSEGKNVTVTLYKDEDEEYDPQLVGEQSPKYLKVNAGAALSKAPSATYPGCCN